MLSTLINTLLPHYQIGLYIQKMSFVTEQCKDSRQHLVRREAQDLISNTYFYRILTDLIDSLWSIVKKSFARNPVVFSQLHSILGT